MKNLKLTAVALFLTIIVFNASAQQHRAPHHKNPRAKVQQSADKIAEIKTDRLDQALELTDAQEKKIYAINLSYAQESIANKQVLRETAATNNETPKPSKATAKLVRVNIQDRAKVQMVEIMQVLTDEQKIEYAILIGKMHNRQECQNPRAPKPRAVAPRGKKGDCSMARTNKVGRRPQQQKGQQSNAVQSEK